MTGRSRKRRKCSSSSMACCMELEEAGREGGGVRRKSPRSKIFSFWLFEATDLCHICKAKDFQECFFHIWVLLKFNFQ